jgi:hypothetical protein
VAPASVRAFDVSPVSDLVVCIEPGARGERDRLRMLTLDASKGNVRDVPGAEALAAKLRFVRFAPDGASVIVIDGDSTISELELATGALHTRWRLEGSAYSYAKAVDVGTDGSLVAALVSADGDLWIAEGRF